MNIAAAVIIQLENSQKNLAIFAIFKFKKWYSQISCKLFFSLTSNYFFQLWEKSQLDNSKLNDELARTRDELSAAKKKLDTVVQVGKKVWFLIFFFFFFFLHHDTFWLKNSTLMQNEYVQSFSWYYNFFILVNISNINHIDCRFCYPKELFFYNIIWHLQTVINLILSGGEKVKKDLRKKFYYLERNSKSLL